MQLYTVNIKMQRLISVFDAKGKKVSDKTTFVEETISDMPLSTATMYRDKFGADNVTLTLQEPMQREVRDHKRHQVQFADLKSKARVEKKAAPVVSAPVAPKPNRLADAAARGDMTAAINQGEA